MNTFGNQTERCYLQIIINEETPVSIYLINGVRLKCRLIDFDSDTINISDAYGDNESLGIVYKSSIATIMPL